MSSYNPPLIDMFFTKPIKLSTLHYYVIAYNNQKDLKPKYSTDKVYCTQGTCKLIVNPYN